MSSKPRYKVGDRIVINHGFGGPNRTITVSLVSANHGRVGAHRYWGEDTCGVSWGAYEDQVVEVSP